MRQACFLLAVATIVAPSFVRADDAPTATARPAATTAAPATPPAATVPPATPSTPTTTIATAAPAHHAKPKPKLPAFDVKLVVEAASPDPPWKLKIVNQGDRTVRIPADARLLSFELERAVTEPKKMVRPRALKCALPTGMRPSSVTKERALYLAAGESYEEWIDPRLYCFGATTDALREGTKVVAEWGFSRRFGTTAVAVDGIDRPAERESLRSLRSEPFVLPAARGNAMATPLGPSGIDEDDGDRNAPRMEIFVDRFAEASSAREVVINFKASNEGKRALATVLRSRMLELVVEHLGADNTPMDTTECPSSGQAHATAIELGRDIGAGKSVTIPVLASELCPKNTFHSVGLYRVRARLDARASGEIQKSFPFLGEALALQQTLIRVANARHPFYHVPPRLEPRATPAPGAFPAGTPSSEGD